MTTTVIAITAARTGSVRFSSETFSHLYLDAFILALMSLSLSIYGTFKVSRKLAMRKGCLTNAWWFSNMLFKAQRKVDQGNVLQSKHCTRIIAYQSPKRKSSWLLHEGAYSSTRSCRIDQSKGSYSYAWDMSCAFGWKTYKLSLEGYLRFLFQPFSGFSYLLMWNFSSVSFAFSRFFWCSVRNLLILSTRSFLHSPHNISPALQRLSLSASFLSSSSNK